METYAENVSQKPVLEPFLILVNSQDSQCKQVTLLKTRYFERGLSKKLKTISLIFSFELSPFYVQDYGKQQESGTSYQSLQVAKHSEIFPFQ